ncbi:hypothetical protein H2199_001885 [Coniosporium tulheliwenetii]|nr:hypothetical protein H2199_001885 [Cladosporium sp. JES 115]
MTYCNGDTVHFFCRDCAANYVKAEVGQSKCRPKCMDTSGCGAEFSRGQLISFLDRKTFDKLENLQQQEDIRNAGLKDLAECPFCDFKAILPPVHVDREFRCHNTECEKISCRLCKLETHIPLTCEQNAKERKGSMRHAVEEAMSEALIRSCNRCKNKFVKDWGCNKMACTSCGNRQCYVCSQDVHDYQHFGAGRCPLYDDTDARHDDEVKAAEAEALKKVRNENPDMTEDELKVKVSDAVKAQERQARERRRQQNPDADIYARMHGGGHMMGHGMVFADPHAVPHAHQPQMVPPPFIHEAFGAALYGMPANAPFQVPHLLGPMPMMGPQNAAAHFYGVAPQPFANYPHVHNHGEWVNFMQQEMAHRHR